MPANSSTIDNDIVTIGGTEYVHYSMILNLFQANI